MTPDTVVNIGQHAMQVTVLLAAPVLLAVLVIGLAVGMFQAATQINELTLSFVPKLVVAMAVLLFTGSWMLQTMIDFVRDLIESIPSLIG
jgi:flagellar biosynthetic protein FliQ